MLKGAQPLGIFHSKTERNFLFLIDNEAVTSKRKTEKVQLFKKHF